MNLNQVHYYRFMVTLEWDLTPDFFADPSSESSITSASSQPSSSSGVSFMEAPLTAPSTSCTGTSSQSPVVRRGPGRPRLKPSGPSNAGSRGTYRPRKPARPLPVPLPSDGTNLGGPSSNSNNPQYSSYSFYDFPDD